MSSPRELLESYIEERSLRLAPSTVAGDRHGLERFLRFLASLGITEVGCVSFEHLEAYRRRLETVPGKRGKVAAPSSVRDLVSMCRLFLLWSYESGRTLVDFQGYELPRSVKPKVEVPAPEQMRKLLEAPDSGTAPGRRDRLILEFFYTLGLRRRECHGLDLVDVNLSRRTVRVLGKGHERMLPVSSRLCALLADYVRNVRPTLGREPDDEAFWLSSQSGKRLCSGSLKLVVQKNAAKVGLGRIYPHLLRHACATHLVEGGAPLEQVQRYLGHRTLDSTERYTHLCEPVVRREVRRCHPRHRDGDSETPA